MWWPTLPWCVKHSHCLHFVPGWCPCRYAEFCADFRRPKYVVNNKHLKPPTVTHVLVSGCRCCRFPYSCSRRGELLQHTGWNGWGLPSANAQLDSACTHSGAFKAVAHLYGSSSGSTTRVTCKPRAQPHSGQGCLLRSCSLATVCRPSGHADSPLHWRRKLEPGQLPWRGALGPRADRDRWRGAVRQHILCKLGHGC